MRGDTPSSASSQVTLSSMTLWRDHLNTLFLLSALTQSSIPEVNKSTFSARSVQQPRRAAIRNCIVWGVRMCPRFAWGHA